MKKCIAVLLCVCSLCALIATASAAFVGEPDYIAEYEALYGKLPIVDDYSSYEEYQAAYDVWYAGFSSYVDRRFAEYEQQKKAAAEEAARIAAEEEEARKAAEKEAEEKAVEAETPITPPKAVESAGSNNVTSSNPVDTSQDTGFSDKYPVGSYVDPAGNVYSPDGELLSPGTTPASAPPVEASQDSQTIEDPDPLAVTASTWYVEDLRSDDALEEVLTGLKALVASIFGEYTPVTTTSVISETVGDDIHQYLIDTVAPGAAGVDYEWIAGVVLFAIMLYCLMKLFGGVLK